uniref:Col_cuticle_N domain-containing protein n=1 Tax=Steinernema glaseri TaxID=37863 RepID=A0A1I7ZM74_9BILA
MFSGYESMKDASRSVEYLSFLAVTLLIVAILLCFFWLAGLLRHLKYEYGEMAKQIVNYDASKERKTL